MRLDVVRLVGDRTAVLEYGMLLDDESACLISSSTAPYKPTGHYIVASIPEAGIMASVNITRPMLFSDELFNRHYSSILRQTVMGDNECPHS